jgi:DNA repair exonuclease SbcCD ATPase subunit
VADAVSYSFPRIKRIQLHSFSLFRLRPDVAVPFSGGVLCLAGANGIGKSTFLSTVNYGLTGAVPHPRRRLLSIPSYIKEATEFSNSFFEGRIDEQDRDAAAVTVEFSIKEKLYSITRGLFDPADVRRLEITSSSFAFSSADLTASEKEAVYKERVTNDIGLNSFEQFIFLQHFVFTFDESRHLLFWDEAATAQALFLSFGGDATSAQNADIWFREAEKAGSRGRNFQFQVNNLRKRIEIITQTLGTNNDEPDNIEELDASYQAMISDLESLTQLSEKTEKRLSEAEIDVAEKSAAVAALRSRYSDTFNQYVGGGRKIEDNPLIVAAIRHFRCEVCNSTGPAIAARVKHQLDAHLCPVCSSSISREVTPDQELRRKLEIVDEQLAKAREEFDNALLAKARATKEMQDVQSRVVACREKLSAFENSNQDLAEQLRGRRASREGPVAQTLKSLEEARTEMIAARDAAIQERDKFRNQLRILQRDLELRYAQAEEQFVPRFRQLTNLFLGIDLDVSFAMVPPTSVKLTVEMRGDVRHDQTQMSESQRFFVDIALRMALAQQISSPEGLATLFIDTPEGSLDIAYEDRAGEMFAEFVESGHDLIVTANINSSKLLQTLAQRCGTKRMTLNQMTGWTELSDVQQKATTLFHKAYEDILTALQTGPT